MGLLLFAAREALLSIVKVRPAESPNQDTRHLRGEYIITMRRKVNTPWAGFEG